MGSIVFYFDKNSPFSAQAKKWLDDHSITYELKDVSLKENLDELYAKTEQVGLPTLVIGEQVIIGFRPREYEAAFLAKRDSNPALA